MSLRRDLADAVGADHVLTDPDLTASYVVDWTGRFRVAPGPQPPVVVRPGDTAQVAAVLLTCAEHGAAVVPQGGNTGLVGGSVPRTADQVVLSTSRLDHVSEPDITTRSLVAGAGATVAAVQAAARAAGLRYGVDLASRDTATVGGTVATNAGGLRVVRHGTTRAQVLGLEAVLADGRVVSRLDAPPQDNAGLDLTGLLVGSEGVLAVVTAARLRLVPPDEPGYVVLVGTATVDEAIALLPPTGLRAAELMRHGGVDLVQRHAGLPAPLARPHEVYLLLETDELPDLPGDADAVVDDRVWAYRELHTEAIAAEATRRGRAVHKLDVSLPLRRLAAFVDDLDALASAGLPADDVHVFGHLAMGNLHVNVLTDDESDLAVLRLVARHGGSIAAEHGVGVAKAQWLHLSRSEAEISLLRAVKRAFDPAGLLNPGVMLTSDG